MALFKIFKGLKQNLPTTYRDGYCYFTIDDGKMYIDTKDNDADGRCVLNAEKADRLVTSEVGTIKRPVYFTGGKPTQCVNSFVFHEVIGDVSNIGGEDLYVKRTGDSMTGMLTATGFNGPLYGNALSADKLNTNKGNSTNPVYFDNGVPVACTGTTVPVGGQSGQVLTTNSSGNAEWKELVALPKGGTQNQILIKNSSTDGDASWGTNAPTASKLATARTIRTNLASTSTASFNGSANVTPGVTGILGIGNGGTGASTKSQARTNLDLDQVKIFYEIDLSSYSTNNFYLIDFGCSDKELDCEIHSNNLGGNEPYNQNIIHFLMIHNGWSDTPKSFTVLSQGCYTSTELTIMSVVSGTQSGLRGVYVRGGLTYRIISNYAPTLNLTTKTLNNESYASGTTSYTTITNADTIWTNNGTNRASWSVPLYGAVWNDYAEYRICNENFKPGQVVLENGDDTLSVSNKRLQRGCSVVSDTFGFAIGETDEAKCPIAVSGRVLAYGYESHEEFKKHIGWPVCSGPNGTVSIMTEEEEEKYPSRIIGIISAVPDYATWGTGNVEINNRIWIKVK